MGSILLAGGAEFTGEMEEADRRALEKAGGPKTPVCIIPAAAAPDSNHDRAGARGVDWFRSLGATDVSCLPLVDRLSAEDPQVAAALTGAGLIYLLGGFPGHLAKTLSGTRSWFALLEALEKDAVVAGSSAGAMVLCEHFYDPYEKHLQPGLGLLKGVAVMPHHASFGRTWASILQKNLPRTTLVGIDEKTALLNTAPEAYWQVYGWGSVSVYLSGRVETYSRGGEIHLARTGPAFSTGIGISGKIPVNGQLP